MKNFWTDQVQILSRTFDIEETLFERHIDENGLNVGEIIDAVKNSGFSSEDIKQLFHLDHRDTFNPFLFLITELKDSIKNIAENTAYFDNYNLKYELLSFYFGVSHLINEDQEMLLPVLKPLLKNFDKKINEYVRNARNGKEAEVAIFCKKILNMLKFWANRDVKQFSSCKVNYNQKIINIGYMRMFLDISEVDEEERKLLNHSELALYNQVESIHDKEFFANMELYEIVIFDKIVELILTNYEKTMSEIDELMDYFIYEAESAFEDEQDEPENTCAPANAVKAAEETQGISAEMSRITYVDLERLLKEKIIGQDVIIEQVIQRLKIADFRGSKEAGAKAVFLLIGPTGVGKTEIVKLISRNITDKKNNDDNFIRIDMSEYKEYHTVSKIIGAPPGYVGYESKEDNTVFDKIIKKPNAIILLDEVEKAHPEVLDVFLHIFDEGKAKTNKQKEVDFSNNIIFMTSNIGTVEANSSVIGFGADKYVKSSKHHAYKKTLEKYLRPEFINRIDEIIVFNDLNKDQLMLIIQNQIRNIEINLETSKQININIQISEEGLSFLIDKMQFIKYGAREVRRTVEKYILHEIIELLITKDIKTGIINITCEDGQLIYGYQEAKVLAKGM